MPIVVPCPTCNSRLNAPDAAAGRKVKCPKCQTFFQIPTASAPEGEIAVVVEQSESVFDFHAPSLPPVKPASREIPAPPPVKKAIARPTPPPAPAPESSEPVSTEPASSFAFGDDPAPVKKKAHPSRSEERREVEPVAPVQRAERPAPAPANDFVFGADSDTEEQRPAKSRSREERQPKSRSREERLPPRVRVEEEEPVRRSARSRDDEEEEPVRRVARSRLRDEEEEEAVRKPNKSRSREEKLPAPAAYNPFDNTGETIPSSTSTPVEHNPFAEAAAPSVAAPEVLDLDDDDEPQQSPRAKGRRRPADEEDGDDPRPRRRKKPAAKKGLPAGLLIGGGIGLLLLLVGAGIGGYYLFAGGAKDTKSSAATSKSDTADKGKGGEGDKGKDGEKAGKGGGGNEPKAKGGSASITKAAIPKGWMEFKSEDGLFKMYAPGEMEVLTKDKRGFTYVYAASTPDRQSDCVVTVLKLTPDLPPGTADNFINSLSERDIVLSKSESRMAGRNATEIILEMSNNDNPPGKGKMKKDKTKAKQKSIIRYIKTEQYVFAVLYANDAPDSLPAADLMNGLYDNIELLK